ncbi:MULTISPECIES: hypothetical protein [Pontibacillus]|uniref:Uncharacterized protein n=1 Tax=Pontibacillus chungwhensis TaxID=265426 RepID=A0ABY8UWB6_9BACI|nr:MULTISPECIES: hypothetical protein [Pontibacillus]MCD5324167.1 hypothetical protein [Pontibacillus sp. HN14]WIF97774.1 hypothetical protein QNI29_18930 [Pontibacillus chungwhensis]
MEFFAYRGIRQIVFSTLALISLGYLLESPSLFSFLSLLVCGYLGVGRDIIQHKDVKKKVHELLKEEESLHLLNVAYHAKFGKGFTSLTDRQLLFTDKKGELLDKISLSAVTDYGYEQQGTGNYVTTHEEYENFEVSKTTERKRIIFFIEYHSEDNTDDRYRTEFIFDGRHKKYYKKIEQLTTTGVVAEEKEDELQEILDTHKHTVSLNDYIENNRDSVVSTENIELDNICPELTGNSISHMEGLYKIAENNHPKINALIDKEKKFFLELLSMCYKIGNRIGIISLQQKNADFNLVERIEIPEIISRLYRLEEVPDLPVTKKLVYLKYKDLREFGDFSLPENVSIEIMENYIKGGYASTVVNYSYWLEEAKKLKNNNAPLPKNELA